MKQRSLLNRVTPKRTAVATAALCAACCTIPVVGLALGFTAVTGLGVYFDRAAIGFFIAGSIVFIYLKIKRRNAACAIDGSCSGSGCGKT